MSIENDANTENTSEQPLLKVENLRSEIPGPRGTATVLSGVNFQIKRGETVGLVGESGSGKSMFVRSLMGISPPKAELTGSAVFDGQDLLTIPRKEAKSIWGRRMGMIFQDPMTSMNPVVPVGKQVSEAARHHLGLSRDQAAKRSVELLDMVGIPEASKRTKSYPHEFSGGMRQRATIAMALACEPDLLIADEATTALDVTVQRQILDLLEELQRERHMAMILVTHDLGVVSDRTDRVAVMYAGRIVEAANTRELFDDHRHRYTQALISARPELGGPKHQTLTTIPGAPPLLTDLPPGCPFAPRCAHVGPGCEKPVPWQETAGPTEHGFACLYPANTTGEPAEPAFSVSSRKDA